MRRALLAVTAVLAAGAAAGLLWLDPGEGGSPAPTAEELERGEKIYAASCASCHGVNLEGQPDWQRRLPSGRLPAPPHDASGHTWHHPDGVLFRITKAGPAGAVVPGYASDMPAYDGILTDGEIAAARAFIKSTWPERERQLQAEMSRKEREAGR